MEMGMPLIYENVRGGGQRAVDLRSKLLENRIVLLNGPFDDRMSNVVNAQLLYLDSITGTGEGEPISLYINSPGGSITSGMAILDVILSLDSEVHTIANGLAASMGAFLLACGDKRFATPNAEIMIHQPIGGAQGQATDIEISANRIVFLREKLNRILSYKTGQDLDVIERDVERDKWFMPNDALEYGLIDEIIKPKKDFIEI